MREVVIVGSGSAGCVLAARLSEDPDCSVTLLEAGPDYPDTASLPPEIASGVAPAFSHDWGYRSEPGSLGRSLDLYRGRVHGLDGLWVVDASIMPATPAAGTNLPTIMVAERCAAWLT